LRREFRLQTSIVGILIGLGCLAVLFRQVELKQSWHTLGRLSGPFILIPLVVFLINLPLRASRWYLIFPVSARPRFGSCLVLLGIGNMANFLLPGRAGDLARCALAGPGGSLVEGSRTLATLAVERVLDGLALIGMVLFSIWALQPPTWVLGLLRIAILFFSAALMLLVVLRYRARNLVDLVRGVFRRIHLSSFEERFDGILTSFADGLSAVTSWGRVLTLILLTGLIWFTEALLIWGLAKALGMAVSVNSAVVASAILGLGFMIPAAPGGLGTYELFGTEAFKMVGLTANSALALTVLIHAWVFVANVLAGLALLGIKGLSLAQLRHGIDAPGQPAPEEIGSGVRPSL